MTGPRLECLSARIAGIAPAYPVGRVVALSEATLRVAGFAGEAALGDQVEIRAGAISAITGEIIRIDRDGAVVLPGSALAGVAPGDLVALRGPALIAPDDSWIGRVIDPLGQPLDGRPLMPGPEGRDMRAPPPRPAERRG
ncbi:MAG: flagellum-specific ATP synthase FliI, partial [Mangrovicoccus sp.]|nr:flagellum-specific ATP synthase FliI [Mangrovicoccus sp.]